MNTVEHKRKIVARHEVRMYGPINARDLQDFVFQVNNIFEKATGSRPGHDDAYYVTGDDRGITATFETLEEK